MTMTREEYVTFETAKLLKKAGFPQDNKYYARYNRHGQDWHMGDGYDYTLKPSQSMAMRWLREAHHINIRVSWHSKRQQWFFDMLDIDNVYDYFESEEYLPTYEAATEEGIQAACKYMIKKGGEQ